MLPLCSHYEPWVTNVTLFTCADISNKCTTQVAENERDPLLRTLQREHSVIFASPLRESSVVSIFYNCHRLLNRKRKFVILNFHTFFVLFWENFYYIAKFLFYFVQFFCVILYKNQIKLKDCGNQHKIVEWKTVAQGKKPLCWLLTRIIKQTQYVF